MAAAASSISRFPVSAKQSTQQPAGQSRAVSVKSSAFKGFIGLKNFGESRSSACYLGGDMHDSLRAFAVKPLSARSTDTSSCRIAPGHARAAAKFKVAVLGAAGGIGQPLSLMLKMSPLLSELRLYDIANVKGVAADLSHCNTPAKVSAFTGADELASSLKGVDLIIIPAGVPRKPGMTRDDLFNINAGIVKSLVEAAAENAPDAWINVISNPVNSTVPIAAEILKQKGKYNPKKLFGVTTLDVVRANTFVAERKDLRLIDVDVPVVGGHAGITIMPLLSKTRPRTEFTPEEVEQLTLRIQNGGTEVVEAKAGAGSATLSMAYAAARFAESCLRAMDGDADVFECTFVQSQLIPELPFFASRVKLGKEGVEAFVTNELRDLTEYERKGLDALKTELKSSIEKGINFVNKQPAAV